MAQNKGCKTFFIKPDYSFFWGGNCKKNGVKCLSKISNFSEVTKLNNNIHKFCHNKSIIMISAFKTIRSNFKFILIDIFKIFCFPKNKHI